MSERKKESVPAGRPASGLLEETAGDQKGKKADRQEEHWRSLVETASVWIWEIDAELRHTYTNAFVTKCLGYEPEEFLRLDTLDLIHPEDRVIVEELVRNASMEKKGWTDKVLRWRHKDNSWRYIESSGSAVFDEKGMLTGLRGVDRDITDRIRAERALQESRGLLETVIEAAPT